MDDVRLQVFLEGTEVVPVAAPEELVFDVAEQALRARVVQAVALPRHALHHPGRPKPLAVARVLVLPAHVAPHDRLRASRQLRQQHVEHLLLLREVRRLADRPGDYLAAAEVVGRGEVGLAERALELGNVGPELLPGPVGGEVLAQHVLGRLADRLLVRAVPAMARLPPYAAAHPHLAHHLEHGLVGDARAELCAQAHRDLAVPAPVGRAGEYLPGGVPQLGSGRPLGMRQLVVVRRARQPGAFQQVGKPESPRKLAHGLGPRPGSKPSSAFRAIDFFRYATRARSLSTSRSSSSSRVLGVDCALGLPFGLGRRASASPSRYLEHRAFSGDLDAIPNSAMTSDLGLPRSTMALAAALVSKSYFLCAFPIASSASLPTAL